MSNPLLSRQPVFAVVGHPNKGKSSIVATLARNDTIAIAAASGTTKESEALEVRVGKSAYTLIDTPGFQRPNKVLQWLQQRAQSADQRQAAVREFITSSDCLQLFPDEVRLLKPIMEGAAILYVVDGSRPYGQEYEAEMEILRWTGQASMALINPIENSDHTASWTQALAQYFKIVKLFNAMHADFDKQLSVLEAFSHLNDQWRPAITALIAAHKTEQLEQELRILDLVTQMLLQMCRHQVSLPAPNKAAAEALRPVLEAQFFKELKSIEQNAHHELINLFHYQNLQTEISKLSLDEDLFDTEKWIFWGLNKQQLTVAATLAGATAGSLIDIGLGGSSLALGAVSGGLVGAGSAFFGSEKIAEFKLQGIPLGGFQAKQGPVKNRNFPYVLLGRFIELLSALRERTHAQRNALVIEGSSGKINLGCNKEAEDNLLSKTINTLSLTEKKRFHQSMDRLRRQKSVDDFSEILQPLLKPPQ